MNHHQVVDASMELRRNALESVVRMLGAHKFVGLFDRSLTIETNWELTSLGGQQQQQQRYLTQDSREEKTTNKKQQQFFIKQQQQQQQLIQNGQGSRLILQYL